MTEFTAGRYDPAKANDVHSAKRPRKIVNEIGLTPRLFLSLLINPFRALLFALTA